MKLNNTVTTLAVVGVLALAALAGGLIPTWNVVHAASPVFDAGNDTPSVPENTPPGVNIGNPVSATDDDDDGANNNDIEFGDTLTYSLNGTDADKFDIDASTGQLLTKAPLNFESPRGGTGSDSNEYVVTVTVKDSSGASVTQEVTISVTNVEEEPGAPAAPTVVSTAGTQDEPYSLKVIWYAPDDTGDTVDGYNVEYKKTTETSFTSVDTGDISGTTATITELDEDTSYQVRVRATDGTDTGPWSLSGVGSTNKEDNALPAFGSPTVARNVLENSEPGLVVGFEVSATDDDNVLPLTYQLLGPDANSFDLQASTGQIRTKRGVVYDAETKGTLRVTMTVSDRQGGTDATAVTISVTNVPEAPSTPARPTVRATPGNSRSLEVSWTAPDNTGPAITGYNIRYREGNSGGFTVLADPVVGTSTTIAPEDNTGTTDIDERLTPGASYEVYVRARNSETPSQWSAAGTGRTSIGNSEPVFDDRSSLTETNPTTTRTVAENTRPGQSIGRAVRAVDGNGDARTYRLVAADNATHVAKFDINESTGQILTKASLNHEDGTAGTGCGYDEAVSPTRCTYTVRVQVWDGLDEDRKEQVLSTLDDNNDANDDDIIDDTITVNIIVSDVVEKPEAPTVTVTSPIGSNNTTLVVTWDEPANAGPAITGYRLECTGYKVPVDQCPRDLSVNLVSNGVGTHTIAELTANAENTPVRQYLVRMRADNAEGEGTWSTWVTQQTNRENNSLPTLTAPTTLYVVENAPSARQPLTSDDAGLNVASIQKDDTTDGDSPLTLRLEGPDADLFDIVAASGQIVTRSKLNHEDPDCYDTTVPAATTCIYNVRVKLSDPNGGSVFQTLTINVRDELEPPAKPAAPRVTATSGSGWSLEVTWNAPVNNGPSISSYEIRYRKNGTTDCNDDEADPPWCTWTHTGTSRSAKITTITGGDDGSTQVHLAPRTQYEVQVRALNGEGDSTFADATNWSTSGRGTTGASNERPVFDDTLPAVVQLEVEENTRSGQSVGSAIEATDPDGHRLTYTLDGPGKDSFTITSAGQIRTRAPLNHEERDEYSLTVKVNDGQRKNNSIAAKSVTIEVTDRSEPPSAPGAPRVSGIPGSTDSVRVNWDAPANAGPPITHYNVQYAVSGNREAFAFVTVPPGAADRSMIITGLTAGTRYDVRVRAHSPEGHSDWSRPGTGSPNPDVENRNPAFSSRSHTVSVAENTPPGADVGSLIAALDPDGDTLTYSLEGTDADSFDIIATNSAGQIQTKAALNHEEKARYSVAVRVRDGRGGTDAVNVTINVTDEDNEAPDTPFAPTVVVLSSTSLQVSWDEPANAGPPITDYDYRYMATADATWTEVTNTTITATSATVDGLTPSTSYDVEVRAKNAEGTSGWSNPGNGATNAPGANNPPVFSAGTNDTRSVSASATPGTNIGEPVTATDADTDDTLTYRLEGRDAALFDIDGSSGQLRTRTGITLLVGTTYTVVVVADDTKDTARITVSIEATAAPPNNPPVFSEGATATRSVVSSAPAGTAIGRPVTATDADTGDTVTYRLEGTDAASFDITPASGQLRTRSGVTLSRSSYTVVVVASDTKGEARITVTINVIANRPPAFPALITSRSVAEAQPVGAAVGGPVSAADPDRGDTLTYALSGPDAAAFAIASTGQISTAVVLDYETKNFHAVVVTATDSAGESATTTVLISVTDVGPPSAPAAPAVSETSGSTSSLDVSWTAPSSGAPISDYDVQYRVGSAGGFTSWSHDGVGTTTVITGLIDGTSYQIQVRAQSSEGAGDWSASGTGTTTRANDPPVFGEGTAAQRFVPEDSPVGTGVGGPVSATDPDGDTLNYTLSGADAGSFTIDGSSGQISTAVSLDYDRKNSYAVTVTATDTGGLTGTIAVTISVTEVVRDYGCATRGAVTDNSNSGLVADCEALLRARNTLEGSARLNWSEFIPINRWEGVTVTGGRVTEIDLRARRLNGTLSAALGDLERLTKLNLRSNSLTGAIPASLGDLSNLTVLNLHSNMLSGAIPDLSGTALQELYLTNNVRWNRDANGERISRVQGTGLTGDVPAWLNSMTNLRELWLWGNNLSGTMPNLNGMRSLDKLKLNGNSGLTGITAGKLPSRLRWLIAGETDVGATMPDLSGMTSMTTLWLNNTGLSGAIPVARIPTSVTNLNLKDNSLNGTIPDMSGLDNLRYLYLHRNDLSGDIPGTMGDMASIQRIWLHENELTGIEAGLANAADTLTHLYLDGNPFAGGTCLPGDLANVVNNDFAAASLAACQ